MGQMVGWTRSLEKSAMRNTSAKALFDTHAKEETRFTPDILELQRQRYQPVFVLGQEKRDFPKHDVLKDCVYFGDAFTVSTMFTMVKQNLGRDTYPVPFRVGKDQQGARLKGDLYVVKTPKIVTLDTLYGNGVRYKRERVVVEVPYTRMNLKEKVSVDDTQTVLAWVYLGLEEYFLPLVSISQQFDLCSKLTPHNGTPDYYYFMKKDMPYTNARKIK